MTELRDRAPIRAADIKESNERLVLGMVFRTSCASQSQVARATGLKAPTVFRIFAELQRLGLIAPLDAPPPTAADHKGRRPIWFGTVADAYRVAGLDFRAGVASVVIEDFAKRLLYSEERSIPVGANADQAYDVVSRLLADALDRAPGGPVLGIGVGAPGVVDLAGGAVLEYMRIPGLSGFPLAARLRERFGVTVRMSNNATVAAMAAYRYSAKPQPVSPQGRPQERPHERRSSVFALLLRTGVGGALLRDGVPYESGGKTAVEIGHMIMDPEGPACPCGGHGCLETYLAEDVLISTVARVMPCADIDQLDSLIAAGDARVLAALLPSARVVANALLNVRHLLDPDEFIVISRSDALSSFLANEATSQMAARPKPDGSSPKVRGYRWDAILAGRAACDMVFDGFFA
jgi:predicted NBD/HSP70 family sugar kinase